MTRSRAHTFHKVGVTSAAHLRSFLDLPRGGEHSFRFCVQILFIGFGPCGMRMDLERSDLIFVLRKLPTLLSLIPTDVCWIDDSGVTPSSLSYTPFHLKSSISPPATTRSQPDLSFIVRLFSAVDLFCIY